MARRVAVPMENGRLKLTFYEPNSTAWETLITRLKTIPSRRYHPPPPGKKTSYWSIDDNPRSRQLITKLRFSIESAKSIKSNKPTKKPNIPQAYKDEVLRDVDPRLRDYQVDTIKWAQHHDFRMLDSSDMGCGKSAQAVSCIRTSGIRPVLFIVPATLKINIKRECEMWLNPEDNDTIHIVEGTGEKSMNYADKAIVIINYDILSKHAQYIISKFKPKFAILDEAHALKTARPFVSQTFDGMTLKPGEVIRVVNGVEGVYGSLPKRVTAAQRIILGLTEDQQRVTGIKWNGIKHVIPMSGTFVLNHPGDLFNVLQLIHPERFTNREKFDDFFCERVPGYKPGSVKITGGQHLDLLHCELVEKYMIRRKLLDVCKELPPTVTNVVPFEMKGKAGKAYADAEEDMAEWQAERERLRTRFRYMLTKYKGLSEYFIGKHVDFKDMPNDDKGVKDSLMDEYHSFKGTMLPWVLDKYPTYIGEMTDETSDEVFIKWCRLFRRLKRTFTSEDNEAVAKFSGLLDLAYKAKEAECFKFIDQLLEKSDRKIIVFGVHRAVVDAIKKKYGKIAVKLNGECSMNEKQRAVDAFQNDPKIRIFAGNVLAAGTGLTLTKADVVVFMETGFSAAIIQQCIARAARMGQTSDVVLAYFLVADGSIEARVLDKLDVKRNIMDSIVDGVELDVSQSLGNLWEEHKKNK